MFFITKIEESNVASKMCELVKTENNLPSLTSVQLLSSPHFVVVEDKEIIGIVGIGRSNWFSAEVFHLCVIPEHRRKGAGKTLTNFSAYFAKEVLQKKVLTCTVRADNIPSNNMMISIGFKLATQFKNGNDEPINYYILNL